MSGVLTVPAADRMMLVVPPARDPAWKETTLGPVVLDYLAWLADRRLSPNTIVLRTQVLSLMCRELDGYRVGDLSGKDGRLVLEGRLIRGVWAHVRPNTLGNYISILKAFWGWAYDEELVLHDPARRLEQPKQPERQYNLFGAGEETRLVTAQPFTRDRVALMLHFEFAMRATDLRLLQLGDIDLGRQAVRLKNGKGGTDRTLSFRTRAVFEAVNTYLTLDRQGHPDEFLLYGMRNVLKGEYRPGVTVPAESRRGEPFREPHGDGYWMEYLERPGGRLAPYSESGHRYWWARCEQRAGLPHRRMHDARHTTGTRLVASGKNFRTVSKFLRHASLNTTELYVHLNELEHMRDELWENE